MVFISPKDGNSLLVIAYAKYFFLREKRKIPLIVSP